MLNNFLKSIRMMYLLMTQINRVLLITFLFFIPFMGVAAVFTSQADGDWHNPATWGEATNTPTSADDVIISGHYVTLTAGGVTVKSLAITNTAANHSKLDVNGNLSFNVLGNLIMTATNAAYNVDLVIQSTTIFTVDGNMLMERSIGNVQSQNLNLNIVDSGQLIVNGTFDYIYNDGTETSLEITLMNSAIFNVVDTASILMEDGEYFTFNISGNAQAIFESDLTLQNNGGKRTTINITSGGKLEVRGNLTINSITTTHESDINVSINSKLDLNGDLVFIANNQNTAMVDISSTSKIYIGGNILRPNNYGDLNMDLLSEIYFDGSTAQTIPNLVLPGAGTDQLNFGEIIFQNTSPEGITLGDDLTVTGNLELNTGKINTAVDAILIIDNGASVTGGSATAFVDGPMIKRGTNLSTFTFPTGNNGIYAPITIDPGVINSTLEYTAEYIGCPPPTINNFNSPLQGVNSQGYWLLERSDAASVGIVKLHWDDADASGITNLASLAVSYFDPIEGWYSIGNGATTGGTGVGVSGSVKSDIGDPPPTIANRFAIGSTSAEENVLPVELINFRAYKSDDQSKVYLQWETASEQNSSYFSIEKSTDGLNFFEVDNVEAAQNSTTLQFYSAVDENPNKGNNYYRIQQVDLDNAMTFSRLVNIFIFEETDAPIIYPNPVQDYVRLYSKLLHGQEINVRVIDISGKTLYINPHMTQEGQIFLSVSNMNIKNPGIYFINYEDNGQVFNLKFMVK